MDSPHAGAVTTATGPLLVVFASPPQDELVSPEAQCVDPDEAPSILLIVPAQFESLERRLTGG